MPYVSKISNKTIQNLKEKEIQLTPYEYEKEFNRISKTVNYISENSKKLEALISSFSDDGNNEIKKLNINSFEDIIPFVLNKITNDDDIIKIINILSESLEPVISENENEKLTKCIHTLESNPNLIFEKNMQKELTEILSDSRKLDKQEFQNTTNKLNNILNSYTNNVSRSLVLTKEGKETIGKLNLEIKSVEVTDHKNIKIVHNKIESLGKNIEFEINKTTTNLENSKSEIELLKEEINNLENKLQLSKEENKLDFLTKTLNRKAYEEHVKLIEEKYKRTGEDYAIVFFDLDYFKKVNDDYGHDAGDVILTSFSKILLKTTRENDIIGRYGGEEFIAILFFKEIKDLNTYIIRLKSIVSGNTFKYKDEKINVTFSSGVTIRSQNDSYESAIIHADELLYKAKKSGRNKTIFQNGTEI